MGVVANLLVKISGDSSALRKELASTRSQLKNAFGNEAIQASQKTLKNVKLLTAGFIALGAASVKMAAEVQQTRTALVTLLRSTEAADNLLKEIKTFAATTPFEFKGLAQASQQMIAFGFEAKAIVPILRTVGDAVSGLGGDQETMDGVVRVLGQIQTMGKVTAKEILQLSRQGINAYQYLADAAGTSTAQVQNDLKKGAVSSSQAIQAIVLGMNKQFAGGMENQGKTLMGLWATVSENVTGVMRQIGASINEGFSLEESFGEFSKWLTKFTLAVDNSGFKQAIKDMVPDSIKLGVIALAAAITAQLIPALVLATKAAFTTNAAIGLATGPIAIAVAAIALLTSEITGYTKITKTAIEKTVEWWRTLGQNRKILKEIAKERGYEYVVSYGGSVQDLIAAERKKRGFDATTPSGNSETVTEKATSEAKALEEALASVQKKSAAGIDSTSVEKAAKAYEKLKKEAESTSKSIESAWLDMTGSQRDILKAWHRDQLEELEKSKSANTNYQRDKVRLEQTYQEKLRQILNSEAKERAATIKEITDSYRDMYNKLNEMGLRGSTRDIFQLEKAAQDDIKGVSDQFAKLTADFVSATAAQKKNLLDGLNEAGAAYRVTAEGMLDFSEEKAKYEAERFIQLQKDKVGYYRQCRDVQSDIDEAYNQLSLKRLQEILTAENAMRLGNMEAVKAEMGTYVQSMLDACAPISLMFANLTETFRTGFADAITDVLTGVSTLSDAFAAFGKSLLKVIAEYYAKQIAGRLAMSIMGKQTLAAETVASIAAGTEVAAAWAAAAANVSLASFGANAAPAMAGISATHALTTALSIPQLAEGGLTTGPTIAMIGEGKYKEAVLPLSDRSFDKIADGISRAGGREANTTVNVYGDINNASDEDRILKNLFKRQRAALMGA